MLMKLANRVRKLTVLNKITAVLWQFTPHIPGVGICVKGYHFAGKPVPARQSESGSAAKKMFS